MLRFPNPGSDIATFIKVYIEISDALADRSSFGLDDISSTLVERNLATSCGYMGEQALLRSTREDRSRDPLYNQSKMYSELYKALGWMHPTEASALVFTHTYLGAHVPVARRDPGAIFAQSLLGIAHPTPVLKAKGQQQLRPFAAILRAAHALGGLICRDEMILGPLSLQDDRDDAEFSAMIEELQSLRGHGSQLQPKMAALSDDLRITPNTMRNYTRFPLAALKWTRWMAGERRRDIYGTVIPFLRLTPLGEATLEAVEACRDIRAAHLENASDAIKGATSRLGFYHMMQGAGFDIGHMQTQLLADRVAAAPLLGREECPVLFSPFQQLEPAYVASLFADATTADQRHEPAPDQPTAHASLAPSVLRAASQTGVRALRPLSTVSLSASGAPPLTDSARGLSPLFAQAMNQGGDLDAAVEIIVDAYRGANQDAFYPFVVDLFRALGYECEQSRAGTNYQRWDAIIPDDRDSIPIEIKSPGEEEYISVKAVRQALENKVVLVARKAFPTQYQTTSLIVGYNLPNDRSEVATLVFDIYKAFGIVIGIIDLRSLLRLAGARILQMKEHSRHELRSLHGYIDVSDP